jgi:hypothetical protein
MKKLFLLIALSTKIISGLAQCAIDTTHTDPTAGLTPANGGATPANGTFQQNTFDWTKTGWNDYIKVGNVLQYGSVNSPYYSSNLFAPFASSAASDFQPTEGWELIKQDFGYFYSAGEWNGNALGNVPPYPGDPRKDPSKLNYLILYNKYSALLRVMTFMYNTDPVHINTIYVKMSFLTKADYQNTPTYQPTVNALFGHYNPISGLALDQKTEVTVVSAPAKFPSGSDMFYADFQLAYDPCLCLFQSGLEVNFYSIDTANLVLSGSYAGTNIPLAAVTGNLGSIYGSQKGDQFIASVYETGNTPQSAILSYQNAANLSSTDAAEQNSLNNLSLGLAVASDLADATSTIPVWGPIGTALKDALDAGSKVAAFYSAKIKDSPAAAVTLATGYLQATGKIMYNPTTYEDLNFSFGVPGSKTASTLPEYAPVQNGGEPLPNYPMYNEPTGTFNLLQTPQVSQYSYVPALHVYTSNSVPFVANAPYDYVRFEYHPSADLIYALNPIWDASKSTINIAYEIDGRPFPEFQPAQNTPFFFTNEGNLTAPSMDFLYNTNPNNIPNSFARYRTKTFPIGCNQSIYTKEQFGFSDFTSSNTSDPNYFSNVSRARIVTLVVMLTLTSHPDVYGKTHYTAQILKYNCKVNPVSTDFEASGAGATALAAITSLPSNLSIPTTTYTSAQDVFSFGTITINNANQTDNAPSNGVVNIIAENEIDITGNVYFTGDINLYDQELPNAFASCSANPTLPFSGSMSDYCTNANTYAAGNGYKADSSARMMSPHNTKSSPSLVTAKVTTIETKLGSTIKLGIFPNPTSGVVYLNLSAQNAGEVLVNISDLNGNQVMQTNFSANEGANSFKLDIGSLNSGAYFINITDENGITIKNDKLILMGQ